MRIVGGRLRGRAIAAPAGAGIRPTADRVREAVFNILTHGALDRPLEALVVLDGFAGTGAIGLEAISRGAARVILMEHDRNALALCRANARKLGADGVEIIAGDCTHPPRARAAADLVFLDPPYRSGLGPAAITALARAGWIADGALVVVELSAAEPFKPPPRFAIGDERRYGAARIVFLKGKGAADA
ncbi:MAG: 16S rRNA (guanine(966)-N(2))-methyltransferase RsmD [Alphaproteobacteria bacterium]|nr:16S rRNA (guanine(966)-N(2))-methyltransferase RsmD [Alphaproteobacteria bacterium]